MAKFVKMAHKDGRPVWVNFDLIVDMQPIDGGGTQLTAAFSYGDNAGLYRIAVRGQVETVARVVEGATAPNWFAPDWNER